MWSDLSSCSAKFPFYVIENVSLKQATASILIFCGRAPARWVDWSEDGLFATAAANSSNPNHKVAQDPACGMRLAVDKRHRCLICRPRSGQSSAVGPPGR
jgi:hypothetical protein